MAPRVAIKNDGIEAASRKGYGHQRNTAHEPNGRLVLSAARDVTGKSLAQCVLEPKASSSLASEAG